MLDLKVKLRQKSVSPSDSDGAVLTGGTSRHPSWWELQFQANEGEQCWGEIAGRRESEYEVVVLTDLQQQQRTRRNEVRNWCQLDTWGHGTACYKGALVIDLREKSYLFDCLTPCTCPLWSRKTLYWQQTSVVCWCAIYELFLCLYGLW